MSLSRFSLIAALASFALAAPAQAFLASNNLVVEPRGDGFFVPFRGASAAREFWCAAGDFAQQRLGAGATTRIWRTSEPPRRSGEGIAFSLSPTNAARSTGLLTFGRNDGSLSVAAARHQCTIEELLRR